MNQVPVIKRKLLEKMLIHLGFEKKDQSKCHGLYKHPDGRVTTIPYYRSRNLARPLLRLILKDIDIDDVIYCNTLTEITK